MSFPRYPAYKPSGVEWLGEVPEHWEVKPLKRVAEIQTGLAKGKEVEPEGSVEVPFLRVANVQDNFLDLENVHMITIQESSLSRYLLRPGDVLMNEGGDFDKLGRGCIWDGVINPCIHQNHVFAVRPHSIRPSWLNAYTSSKQANSYFISRSKQSTNLASISSSNLMDLPVPIAPNSETEEILGFLDRETAKIDALIAEQQRLIELLQEKRQAVISHAVTKGLNPNAPMKNSGVECLGEVPEHWEVSRLGWIAEQVNDINHEMPEAVHSGVPFLSAKDLGDDGSMNFENDVKQISEEDFNRLSQKIKPERGDIIYSRIGTIGRAALVDTDERFLVSYSCCVIRVRRQNIHLRFLRDLLASDLILTESKARTRSMGQPDLGLGEIRKFPIPIPPVEEQKAIDRYLTKKIGGLDAVCSKTATCLNLLQERRSALISAAVTGQIDVRRLVEAGADER